ncbi:MAG: 50S ribosomal protein L23 [Candidatus Jordarchaeaceae archaeon]
MEPFDPWKVIIKPVISETALRKTEMENELVFIVDKKANKHNIKVAIEKLFNVKVESVNILITSKGEKKAYVKLKTEYSASDIASKMGIL